MQGGGRGSAFVLEAGGKSLPPSRLSFFPPHSPPCPPSQSACKVRAPSCEGLSLSFSQPPERQQAVSKSVPRVTSLQEPASAGGRARAPAAAVLGRLPGNGLYSHRASSLRRPLSGGLSIPPGGCHTVLPSWCSLLSNTQC